jgi:hypothetical protein
LQQDYLTVKIQFTDSTATYSDQFQLYLAAAPGYVHASLDFGSEASQMAEQHYIYSNTRYQQKQEELPLFNRVKDLAHEKADNSQYVQYEPGTNFLKSVYFLKRDLSSSDRPFRQQDFISKDEEIKLLTRSAELNTEFFNQWHQLPNLKLAHKHSNLLNYLSFSVTNAGGQSRTLNLADLKDKAYASIIKQIIKAYLTDKIFDLETGARLYLRFTLLVPNIYTVEDVNSSKNIIRKIIEQLNTESLNGHIRACEIGTISESDASFLGHYTSGLNVTEPNRYYIIIDCGKGTTDFSIIQTDIKQQRELKPLYRNGFAGAGNLISYAVFESVLWYVISQSNKPANAKDFFEDIFSNPDKARMYELFGLIEKLKFNYDPNLSKADIERQWQNIRSGSYTFANIFDRPAEVTLANFLSLLQQCDRCYDWNGYIDQTAGRIVSNIVDNISQVTPHFAKELSCGGILLTGRAFLFKPLQKKLEQQVKEVLKLDPSLIKQPTVNTKLKNVCMDGIFRSNYTVNPELVGFPIQITLRKETVAETVKTGRVRVMALFKNLVDWTLSRTESYDEATNTYSLASKDFHNCRFILGNNLYDVKDGNFYQPDRIPRADLIFTKEAFYVRATDAAGNVLMVSDLQKNTEIDDFAHNYIVPSLFPAKIDIDYMQSLKAEYPDNDFSDFMPK